MFDEWTTFQLPNSNSAEKEETLVEARKDRVLHWVEKRERVRKKYLADEGIGVNGGSRVDKTWFCGCGSVNLLPLCNICNLAQTNNSQ